MTPESSVDSNTVDHGNNVAPTSSYYNGLTWNNIRGAYGPTADGVGLRDYLPTGNTIKSYIRTGYFDSVPIVQDILSQSISKIHLSGSLSTQGPIGKLHNVVLCVRRSPLQRKRLQVKQKGLEFEDIRQPVQDNSTRWNSTYYSLQRAVETRTQAAS
ncbi:hypothetical protein E4U44_001636 [Claviceps purpurea]|nr:hypothetical protein E4U44_001636 [Claviceps purpurea]